MAIKAFAMVYLNSQLEESFKHNKAEVLQCIGPFLCFSQSGGRKVEWLT